MRLFFSLALRNLWFHPVRSGLVASCIAAVCALMVILTALAGGVRGSLVDSAIALVSGHINVLGYYKIGHSSPLTLIEKQDKLQGLLRTGGFAHARIVARVKAIGKAVSEHKSLQLVLWGIDPRIEAQSFAHLIIAPPGAEGGFAARGTIALFAAQAKALGVQPGDALTVTLPIYRGGQQTLDLKVTAILREQGVLSRFHALLNADDLREVYQIAPDATSQIMIFLPDGQTADTSRLADLLTQNGYRLLDVDPSASTWAKLETAASEPFVGQRLEVDTWRDEIAPVAWIVDIFTSFSWLMTVVLMTLVILGLSHTQTMAILERSAEIAAMRAIGLTRRQTVLMFFLEALLLASAGTLVGCALGVTAAWLLDMAQIPITIDTLQLFLMNDRLVFRVEPAALASRLALIALMVTVGALLPAWRAGKLRAGCF